jgi:hypothetical protein
MGSAYVGSTDRLYRGVAEGLAAIDCATDSVVCTIPAPVSGYGFYYPAWDSVGDKLYVSIGGWGLPPRVAVYDCATDSLRTVIDIPSPYRTHAMHFDYLYRKAYYTVDGPAGPAGAIDTRSDTIIRVFPFNAGTPFNTGVEIDTKDHKAYVLGNDSPYDDIQLYVIDCSTDSIVKAVALPPAIWPVDLVRWVPWSNRVYLSRMGAPTHQDLGMYVVDCNTDSIIVSNLVLGYWPPYDFQIDPIRQRVFAIGCESTSIHVLRDVEGGVAEEPASAGPAPDYGLHVQMTSGGYDLRYSVASPSRVELAVYDLMGREVRQLVAEEQAAGQHSAVWNCKGRDGKSVARGVYFVQLRTPAVTEEQKVVVTR